MLKVNFAHIQSVSKIYEYATAARVLPLVKLDFPVETHSQRSKKNWFYHTKSISCLIVLEFCSRFHFEFPGGKLFSFRSTPRGGGIYFKSTLYKFFKELLFYLSESCWCFFHLFIMIRYTHRPPWGVVVKLIIWLTLRRKLVRYFINNSSGGRRIERSRTNSQRQR